MKFCLASALKTLEAEPLGPSYTGAWKTRVRSVFEGERAETLSGPRKESIWKEKKSAVADLGSNVERLS